MPTVTTTPATLWVVPTTPTATVGQVDPPDDCNVIDVAGEVGLDVTCDDHEAQDAET